MYGNSASGLLLSLHVRTSFPNSGSCKTPPLLFIIDDHLASAIVVAKDYLFVDDVDGSRISSSHGSLFLAPPWIVFPEELVSGGPSPSGGPHSWRGHKQFRLGI